MNTTYFNRNDMKFAYVAYTKIASATNVPVSEYIFWLTEKYSGNRRLAVIRYDEDTISIAVPISLLIRFHKGKDRLLINERSITQVTLDHKPRMVNIFDDSEYVNAFIRFYKRPFSPEPVTFPEVIKLVKDLCDITLSYMSGAEIERLIQVQKEFHSTNKLLILPESNWVDEDHVI